MRKALIAAAVTSGVLAAARRLPRPAPAVAPGPVVPAQRRTRLVLDDADDAALVIADQDAQDAAILALLDRI